MVVGRNLKTVHTSKLTENNYICRERFFLSFSLLSRGWRCSGVTLFFYKKFFYLKYSYYIAIKLKEMKKLFKVLTETNKVRFFEAYNKSEVRLKCYQLYGSENFTIKKI